jgi:hypothetical protein
MTDNWLPIGSVVLLEEGNKLLMIYGRAQKQTNADTLWDYIGCPFPEGNIGPDYTFLFNKDQIERVFFIGYQTIEEFELVERLEKELADNQDNQGK